MNTRIKILLAAFVCGAMTMLGLASVSRHLRKSALVQHPGAPDHTVNEIAILMLLLLLGFGCCAFLFKRQVSVRSTPKSMLATAALFSLGFLAGLVVVSVLIPVY